MVVKIYGLVEKNTKIYRSVFFFIINFLLRKISHTEINRIV